MLIARRFLDELKAGRADLAFRRWPRARVTDPRTRAGDLAAGMGMERRALKGNVRKLKELGLTESLEVGYRLSPRGRALLRAS